MGHHLYSICFSHYVERARWALDHFEVPYVESRYMPLFHFPAVAAMTLGHRGRWDKVSSPYSTPLLVLEGGKRVQDSAAISRWASDTFGDEETSLYPSQEVERIERELHDRLGPHTRRAIYFEGLSRPDIMIELARRNVGSVQAALFTASYPLFRRALVKALRITAQSAARSLDQVREVFEELEGRYGGRRYLVGDRLTAADISLACMAAPVLLPTPEHGYGAVLPSIEVLDPHVVDLVEEFRATPTGQRALRLFVESRRARASEMRGRRAQMGEVGG